MRTVVYVVIYALLLQFGLPYVVPDRWIYAPRVEYDTIKNNMAADLGVAMDRVARQIKQHPEQDYVILVGDSVTYSGPGQADQSIGYYLEQWSREQGHPLKVYNFAQPGMMGGDVYAEVLMLKEHGVPTRRVVLNQVYADFAPHAPWEAMFDWLGDDLKRLDPKGWEIARGPLTQPSKPMVQFRQQLLSHLSLWRYRDFLRTQLFRTLHLSAAVEAKDTRPWTAKKLWLLDLMKGPSFAHWVDARPMDLSAANPNVQLVDRTLDALKGSQVLVWFTPVNQEMFADVLAQPGYQENLKQLDAWLAGHKVDYVELRKAVDPALFTDHVHMVPEGYKQVAALLGQRLLSTTAK